MEGSWRVNELSESMWVTVVRLPEIDKYKLIEMEPKTFDEINTNQYIMQYLSCISATLVQ